VTALGSAAYSREVARTIREGRNGSYRYALRRLHRFRFPTLPRLLLVTARNKLAALAGSGALP
jgi:hypothetical protein